MLKIFMINIIIDGPKVEQVSNFKYLGAWMTKDGRRITKNAFSKAKESLNRGISKKSREKE